MLKPVLCAAALAAVVAFPAIAQQSPQGDNPSAGPAAPGPQSERDGRGPGWRGYPERRYSDEDRPGRRWRRGDEGRREGGDDGPRRWQERRFGGPREGMMEHGAMMRPLGMARSCSPEGGRMGEAMMSRIERATQPTAEQRSSFDKLKEAAAKAGDIMRSACPMERSATPTGRLANAEKRLTAMLEAVRTVRPAMDAYYGLLTDEQKARLTLAQPHMGRGGMGERGRERMHKWRERTDLGTPRGNRTENAQSAESERL
jgi:hypothetical protein